MKKGNPVVKVVISCILGFMLILFAFTIYRVVYTASQESDFAYIGDFTTFVNLEDNLKPDYVTNELLIIKREKYYSTSQIVLYKGESTYRLGRVVKTSTSKYYIGDSMDQKNDLLEITYDNIIGSVNFSLGRVGTLFRILTSTVAMVITVIVFFAYIMFAKESA